MRRPPDRMPRRWAPPTAYATLAVITLVAGVWPARPPLLTTALLALTGLAYVLGWQVAPDLDERDALRLMRRRYAWQALRSNLRALWWPRR